MARRATAWPLEKSVELSATDAMIPSTPFGALVRRWSSIRAFCPPGADGHATCTTISVPDGAGSGEVMLMAASPTDTLSLRL